MKKLLVANLVLTVLLIAAVAGVYFNQQHLDGKYNKRWEETKQKSNLVGRTFDHIFEPEKYPYPKEYGAYSPVHAPPSSPLQRP